MSTNFDNKIIILEKNNLNLFIKNTIIELQSLLLNEFEIKDIDIQNINITTKIFSNPNAPLRVPIISNSIFKSIKLEILNEEFLLSVFQLNQLESSDSQKLAHEIHDKYNFGFVFAGVYTTLYEQIFSSLLLLLHFRKIIQLPYNFKIPIRVRINNDKKCRTDYLSSIYPEMLKRCREVNINNQEDFDSNYISRSDKKKILNYGYKMLFSLGWATFEDVNIEDILELRKSNFNSKDRKIPYNIIINFLHLNFSSNFKLNSKIWNEAIKLVDKNNRIDNSINNEVSFVEDAEIDINNINFEIFDPEKLNILHNKLELENEGLLNWSTIQKCYLQKLRKESIRDIKQSLKNFNAYLFLILPQWFRKNKTNLKFPVNPSLLKGSVYISSILAAEDSRPITFTEFLEKRYESGKISREYHYAILKNISSFFDFISLYTEDLQDCKGFINPINDFDYPKLTRKFTTNKGLIPRNIFGLLIAYVETIRNYNNLISQKILNGELSYSDIRIGINGNILNVKKLEVIVGFRPILYWQNKRLILTDIVNLLDFKSVNLVNYKIKKTPCPHLLNHIYVALQTGIRGNHIQWLDAENFNQLDLDKKSTFTKLYVNTDKAKTSVWSPIVHRNVIRALEEQLEWRNLINNPNFAEKKYYNNNEKTKWGKFIPLFSYEQDGRPYSDHAYQNAWLNLMINFQSIIPLFNITKIELVRLLPANIKINDINIESKLKEYGKTCDFKCDLRWTSDITPHSARVSIVSHYITALPADIIGRYITGQTEALVHHYVKLDPIYLKDLEKGQAENINKLAIEKEFLKITNNENNKTIFADSENSNLIQSMNINKLETINQYGCISLNIKEDGKTGVDLLIENSNIKIAFNKTEMCPYNNNCPAEIIKELKGIRRCGICPFAIRSIDHLPAIAVKKRQQMEVLQEIEDNMSTDNFSDEELNLIEEKRQFITEELLGWIVSEELLENNRKNLQDKETYIVKRPEILVEKLQQVKSKEGDIQYLITRMNDIQSFPQLDTPFIKAKIDILRRSLLARLGSFKEAFDMKIPKEPIFECLGLLKDVIKRYNLTQEQVVHMLSEENMTLIKNESLLGIDYDRN